LQEQPLSSKYHGKYLQTAHNAGAIVMQAAHKGSGDDGAFFAPTLPVCAGQVGLLY